MFSHLNVESFTIELDHINIAAKRYGHADKPIIIALHGWLDNADSFLPLVNELSQLGLLEQYQLLAIDWPGHGLSQHRSGHYPLHWIDYVFDLSALVDSLCPGSQKIVLLGHSLGGIIASAYNASFPEKVSQLILIEALSPLFEGVEKAKVRLQKSIKQHKKFNNKLSQTAPSYENISRLSEARHRLTGLDLKWCQLLMDRSTQLTETGIQWRSDPRLKLDSPFRFTFEQVDALMTRSDTPTLLILGQAGFEQLTSPDLPKSNWFSVFSEVTLAGDHHLHMGNATGVAAEIARVLAQLNH